MERERLIIVAYDIRHPRRWRRVFRIMNGYGQWVQLSVFQCRLTRRRRVEMVAKLGEAIKYGEDHVILIDVGLAAGTELAIESLGRSLPRMERHATVV